MPEGGSSLIPGPPHGRFRAEARSGEQGLTSVEYALIAAVVGLLLTGGVYYLYTGIQARFDHSEQCATSAWEGASADC
jgi:Flp pilus assembly pilin Flp